MPPRGALLSPNGYAVQAHIAQGLRFPPTFDRDEIVRLVAHCRERNNVPEHPQSETNKHVHKVSGGSGWHVRPPSALLRKLHVEGRQLYCKESRSYVFPDQDEAIAAYEKFKAPSTSDDERKRMIVPPLEAFICAHCGQNWYGRKGSKGVRLNARRTHERYCTGPSSSEEEESDEDESEEEEPEEAVAPPPPKRARFCEWWPWGS